MGCICTIPVPQLNKQALSPHWSRDSRGICGTTAPLSVEGMCVILLAFSLICYHFSSFCTEFSLCWTGWHKSLDIHKSIMHLLKLSESNWRLVLSAFLISAVIFELGKWIYTLTVQFYKHVFLETPRMLHFRWLNSKTGAWLNNFYDIKESYL